MTRCGNSETAAWWDGLFLSKGGLPGQALATPQPSPSPPSPPESVLQCGGLAAVTANAWLRDDDGIRSKQEPVLGTLREKNSCSSTGNRTKTSAFSRLKTNPTLSSCPHQTHPLQAAAQVKSGVLSCGPVWKCTVPQAPCPPHISCSSSHTGHGPQALPLSWEKERGSQTCFSFFCIFIIIKSGMNVISARHNTKKKIHNEETGEPEVLHPSTSFHTSFHRPRGQANSSAAQSTRLQE